MTRSGLNRRGGTTPPDPSARRQADPGTADVQPGRPGGRDLGDPVPWLIALAVFAAYTVISVFRYLRLDPTSWDLGIFTEYVKQYAHLRAPVVDIRGAGFNLLGDHFHPIVAVLAPFFRLFPSAATLLVAQALLAAISVLPVSRAAAQKLGRPAGRAVGAAYGFSWGLQQMVNYDFHEIAFAVPLLAFSLSALVRGRIRSAVGWALPLVFVKEDQGFTVAAIGIIMIFAYRERGGWNWRAGNWRAGALLACWGTAWSLLAIFWIIPHFNAQHTYPYWSKGGPASPVGGQFSVGGLISQFTAGSATKLPTLAMILLPTAFLALWSPLAFACLPGLALRFVSPDTSFWGTAWHYNATLMPIVFIAAVDGMARIRARRETAAAGGARAGPPHERLAAAIERHGAALMLGIAAALAFQFPLSSLWQPQTYTLGPHVAAANAAMARVPPGVTVETDLDLLAPLAARDQVFWLGTGGNPAPRYIVFDTASTDYQPPPASVPAFVAHLHPGTSYLQVYRADGIYVFRRVGTRGN